MNPATLGQIIGASLFAMIATFLLMPGSIRILHRMKVGKAIRSEGPARHAAKAGTPTMGGAVVIVAAAAATLVFTPRVDRALVLVLFVVAFALLGSIDDMRALRLHRAMGLRAREKFAGQVLLAALLAVWTLRVAPEATRQGVPFAGTSWELAPWLFVLLSTLATTASANAVNLTDGLDGLAAGAIAIASAVYAGAAWMAGRPEVGIFAGAVGGACLGFMWYNGYPAQVFMGDTGSLALGAALAAMGTFTGTLLSLPIVGGLFVVETLSVMAQVAYFRLTGGRRLFRMSPFHHHLELEGWSEPQVVVRLWLWAALFGLVGLWAILSGSVGVTP
ncbi:phospho-N-acetylmuramoyl-pentapeptide-transferase [Carboxydochorda subterranea]|uniref:Phospho-N-acetylmuramoyl-pentapeptide-transferase n=1 Tax=Carboxydichorda subterranea TaxID=3109565 RepID=A0ABZ1C0R8_9FIRM|nr:phospho-N-acetylmuramoyl-pentapeptide-transferase [Limnochorda sp. L945t]WRP18617.1 phospho-N-acetylmuramoyl-pentapeptide-transferase [Limnochorda sp. L945t]